MFRSVNGSLLRLSPVVYSVRCDSALLALCVRCVSALLADASTAATARRRAPSSPLFAPGTAARRWHTGLALARGHRSWTVRAPSLTGSCVCCWEVACAACTRQWRTGVVPPSLQRVAPSPAVLPAAYVFPALLVLYDTRHPLCTGGRPSRSLQPAVEPSTRLTAKPSRLSDSMSACVSSSWGLFDLASKRWCLAAVEACGIAPELLPAIVSSCEALGAVAAPTLGIPSGARVYAAIGDHPCTVLASLRSGCDAAVSIGTSAQFAAVRSSADAAALLRECGGDDAAPPSWQLRPYVGDQCLIVCAAMNGGNALAEFATAVHRWMQEVLSCSRSSTPPSVAQVYAALESAAAAYDTPTMVFRPTFLRERHEALDGAAGASLSGIGPGRLAALGDVYASLQQGLARHLADMVPRGVLRGGCGVLALSGGAAARSPGLQRRVAAAFRASHVRLVRDADAALGAALWGSVAADDALCSASSVIPRSPALPHSPTLSQSAALPHSPALPQSPPLPHSATLMSPTVTHSPADSDIGSIASPLSASSTWLRSRFCCRHGGS